MRSDASAWKTPKSARPTWIRSPAVLRTPAAIESSATISPTPSATPAAVSAVLARPPQEVLPDEPDPRHAPIFQRSAPAGTLRAMEVSRSEVLAALERVIDPELGRPVTELDMVRDVEIDGGDVSVTIALTIAGCPLRSSFSDQVAEHVGRVAGVERTRVGFDVMTADERAALTEKLRGGVAARSKGIAVDRSTRVIAIASGKGGVGKSSLTANLAAAFTVARPAHRSRRRRRLRLFDPAPARDLATPGRGRPDDRAPGQERDQADVDRLLPRRQRGCDVARADAPPSARAVPVRRPLGRPRRAARRHAARARATSRSRSGSCCRAPRRSSSRRRSRSRRRWRCARR